MQVNFNKIEPISSVDYPGHSACVVFFNGCPWRCGYCHNKQTWDAIKMFDVEYVKEQIKACLPFVSAVVFSGGEPTMQIDALKELCKYSKSLGLFVGIETNGCNPSYIEEIRENVDKFFLDIKEDMNDPEDYFITTLDTKSWWNVYKFLHLDIPIEIRIVDRGNAKQIADSIKTNHKITILPYINRNKGSK